VADAIVTTNADLSVTVKCPACKEEERYPWDPRPTDESDAPVSHTDFVQQCVDTFSEEHFCEEEDEDPDTDIDDDYWDDPEDLD
jgi:hypothetical protein